MSESMITLGGNMSPPWVDMETTQAIYDCVKTEEFEIDKFNALLMAIVTYLDAHDVDYGDRALPWAEEISEQ